MASVTLFDWYVITISFSIVFLIVTSILLYSRRRVAAGSVRTRASVSQIVRDFIFVWILISLLALYIVTVMVASYPLFATGNIIVELLLLFYVYRNRPKKTSHP
jgi:uncharacterized membrane protein